MQNCRYERLDGDGKEDWQHDVLKERLGVKKEENGGASWKIYEEKDLCR